MARRYKSPADAEHLGVTSSTPETRRTAVSGQSVSDVLSGSYMQARVERLWGRREWLRHPDERVEHHHEQVGHRSDGVGRRRSFVVMPDLRAQEQSAFAQQQSVFAWEQSSNRGMPYPFAGEPYQFLGRISEESRVDREFVRRRGPCRTTIDEGLASQCARVESASELGASVRAHARMP